MEPKVEFNQQPQVRSGARLGELGSGLDEIHGLILSGASETGVSSSSFTALLELPPPQAVDLLVNGEFPAKPPFFPSNLALIDRSSRFSVFADNSQEKKVDSVKQEPSDTDSNPNSASPAVSNQSLKSGKRKDREKKVKEPNKKSKGVAANEAYEEDLEKLPYVHVRARRGQATDSHSLAERARREKINARMKLLQELVPGCDKISGTAMVLDEIINHVQMLQRQVKFLSMRFAAVNPRTDFNSDAAESGPSIGNSSPCMFPPSVWPEGQINTGRQQQYQQPWHFEGLHQPVWARDDDVSNFVTQENSFLSYDSPANSASLPSSQLKMEL